jgi:hypothetical protein
MPIVILHLIIFVNFIFTKFGPKSYRPVNSENLTELGINASLVEPRDQLILISWWILAIVLTFISYRFVKFETNLTRRIFIAVGSFSTMILIFLSLLWDKDSTKTWMGVGYEGIIFGLVFSTIIVFSWTLQGALRKLFNIIFLIFLAIYFLPALIQTPGFIRDPGHIIFTSDDLVSVAADRWPLYDYIPQYSNLLSFPYAIILKLLNIDSLTLLITYLIVLQVIIFSIAIRISTYFGGRKLIVPAILVVLAPSLSAGDTPPGALGNWLLSATTYFAVLPMRLILPTVLILIIFIILKKMKANEINFTRGNYIFLGFCAGIVLFNNIDFGGAFVAILTIYFFTLFVIGYQKSLVNFIIYLGSITGMFVIYFLLSTLMGRNINFYNYIIFPATYGSDGYGLAEMQIFGIHVIIATLFISTVIIGLSYIKKGITQNSAYFFRLGSLQFIVGGWGLICLFYFAGRSFTPTAIGGFSFLSSFAVVLLLPILKSQFFYLRYFKKYNLNSIIGSTLAFVMLVSVSSIFVKVKQPNVYVSKTLSEPTWMSEDFKNKIDGITELGSDITSKNNVQISDIGIIVESSNLINLYTDIDSIAITSPLFLELSYKFTDIQCQAINFESKSFLITTESVLNVLKENKNCKEIFDLESVYGVEKFSNTYLVVRLIS